MIDRLARALQVERRGDWRCWLLRLVWRPAPPIRPTPDAGLEDAPLAPRLVRQGASSVRASSAHPPAVTAVHAAAPAVPPSRTPDQAIRRRALGSARMALQELEATVPLDAVAAAHATLQAISARTAAASSAPPEPPPARPTEGPPAEPEQATSLTHPPAVAKSGWADGSRPDPSQPVDAVASLPGSAAASRRMESDLDADPAPEPRPAQQPRPACVDGAPLGAWLDRAAAAGPWQGPAMRVMWLGLAGLAAGLLVITQLTVPGEAALAAAWLLLAALLRRIPGGTARWLLTALVVTALARHLGWRMSSTLDVAPGWPGLLGHALLAAEALIAAVLALGLLLRSSAWRRPRRELAEPRADWPSVDVLIHATHEPLALVTASVLAARDLDWPAERLRVRLLDDADRAELRDLALRTGIAYQAGRPQRHAWADSLNHALAHSHGQFVAVIDADQVPVRPWLRHSIAWLADDARLAWVQSRVPDGREWGEDDAAAGGDAWGALPGLGPGAVWRRAALSEIGGLPTASVAEPAHAAWLLQRSGWRSASLGDAAVMSLSPTQSTARAARRLRSAQGLRELARLDPPWRGAGLTALQRLAQTHAIALAWIGLPVAVLLSAPALALLLGEPPVQADAGERLLRGAPVWILMALAWAPRGPRITADAPPAFAQAGVDAVLATCPGAAVLAPAAEDDNDAPRSPLPVPASPASRGWRTPWPVALRRFWPLLLLVSLNALAVGFGVFGLGLGWAAGAVTSDAFVPLGIQLAWSVVNLLVLGVALGTAADLTREPLQRLRRPGRPRRRSTRVRLRVPASLVTRDGAEHAVETVDCALAGVALRGLAPDAVAGEAFTTGAFVVLRLDDDTGEPQRFPARIFSTRRSRVALRFESLTLAQQSALIRCTFARAGARSGPSGDASPAAGAAVAEVAEIEPLWRELVALARLGGHNHLAIGREWGLALRSEGHLHARLLRRWLRVWWRARMATHTATNTAALGRPRR